MCGLARLPRSQGATELQATDDNSKIVDNSSLGGLVMFINKLG